MTHETLQFGIDTDGPDSDALTVYAADRATIGGVAFDCHVIGSSHYISAPGIPFHEIASCRPVSMDCCHTVSLSDDVDQTRRYDLGNVTCTLDIETRPLSAYPSAASFDLAYEFGERALTAIDVLADGYETYHTYTEHDCTVYTRTRFDGLGQP